MEIKKDLKIVNGDCLAYKIENDEEFKGKYLILIASELNDPNDRSYNRYFRCKITENDILVTTKEEIEKLKYVIIYVMPMGMRFYPLPGNRPVEDVIKERMKVKVYPDENGYLYEYNLSMTLARKKEIQQFIYLGNFDISKPKEDFIPFSLHNLDGTCMKYFEEYALDNYRSYNLKQCGIWTDVEEVHNNANELLGTVLSASEMIEANRENKSE